MFRFKLRTLLIATALICVFLGLQVHVHNKAKRFVEEVKNPSEETQKRLMRDAGSPDDEYFLDHFISGARQESLSVTDVVLCRRRCEVDFSTGYKLFGLGLARTNEGSYTISIFGPHCDSTESDDRPTREEIQAMEESD